MDRSINSEKYIWFDLGKIVWKKHCSVFQDHIKYIHKDIVKPFQVAIIRYDDRVQEMHDPAKYLPPPLVKGKSYESDNWDVREKLFSKNYIHVAIKDGLTSSM